MATERANHQLQKVCTIRGRGSQTSTASWRTQSNRADEQEYLAMQKAPPPFIWAVPEEKNILECELLPPSLVSH